MIRELHPQDWYHRPPNSDGRDLRVAMRYEDPWMSESLWMIASEGLTKAYALVDASVMIESVYPQGETLAEHLHAVATEYAYLATYISWYGRVGDP